MFIVSLIIVEIKHFISILKSFHMNVYMEYNLMYHNIIDTSSKKKRFCGLLVDGKV